MYNKFNGQSHYRGKNDGNQNLNPSIACFTMLFLVSILAAYGAAFFELR